MTYFTDCNPDKKLCTSQTFVAIPLVAAVIPFPRFLQYFIFSNVVVLPIAVLTRILILRWLWVLLCSSTSTISDFVFAILWIWLTHELQNQIRVQLVVAATAMLICPLDSQVALPLCATLKIGLGAYKQNKMFAWLHQFNPFAPISKKYILPTF